MRPRYDMSELRRLAADARVATDQLRADIAGVVTDASTVAMIVAQQGAPVFTGELANSIGIRGIQLAPSPVGISMTDIVFASAPHAEVIEEGRTPGAKIPPLGPIFRWVKLRHDRGDIDLSWTRRDGDDAALFAALKLRHAISRKGIAARKFMEAGARRAEPVLADGVDRVIDDWKRRLES